MELIPSAIYHYFLNPFSVSLLLLIVSSLLVFRRNKVARVLLIVAITILWLSSTPLFSSYLIASLERKYLPTHVANSPNADAIVVLGAAVGAAEAPRLDLDLSEASDRIRHAAKLYNADKAPTVISVGGGVRMFKDIESEADSMVILLNEWGVPSDAIITEPLSLNTRQNAVNTKRLLENKDIGSVLLVTSAMHMPRALATFRSAGINTIPSPTDFFIVNRDEFSIRELLPDPSALGGATVALKEYLGFLYYRLRGWIK
jgi:uncharacterized SAM-binding protein YcdF (DUF218 family)